MKFKSLQENLRKTIQQRITAGELTGLRLAERTGFRQAHISNFLNRKRSLSIPGMDRVLNVQRLSVLDLLDPEEVNKRQVLCHRVTMSLRMSCSSTRKLQTAQPLVMSMNVREIQKFKRSFLRKLRPDLHGKRRKSERFVAIRADSDSMGIYPRILPGAIVLLDRHYNSLSPYRRRKINAIPCKSMAPASCAMWKCPGTIWCCGPRWDVWCRCSPSERHNCSGFHRWQSRYVGMEIKVRNVGEETSAAILISFLFFVSFDSQPDQAFDELRVQELPRPPITWDTY